MSLGFVPSDTNSHFALSPSTVTVRLSMTKVRHAAAFSPVCVTMQPIGGQVDADIYGGISDATV